MSGKTASRRSLQLIASLAMSHTKAAWPSEARMVEVCGGAAVTFASFWDGGSDSLPVRIVPVSSQSLTEVHKYSGNHVSRTPRANGAETAYTLRKSNRGGTSCPRM